MAAAGGPVNISPREGPTHHPRTSMDEAAKKTVLRSFPYGLYAVTVAHGGEALGWLECRVVATMPSGDHTLVLGEVVEAGVEREGAALTLQAAGFKYSG